MLGEVQLAALSIEEKLRKMENLLSGIVHATKCLLIISDYDLAINQAIAILGKATEVDRVRIFELSYPEINRPMMSQCFEWVKDMSEGDAHKLSLRPFSLLDNGFERWYDLMKSGNSLKGAVRQFPSQERENQALVGIKSLLSCPIIIKGELWGLIIYENLHSEQTWSDQDEAVLMTVAVGLGSVIERKRAEEALGEAYQDLELRVNERTRELAIANKTLHNEIVERIQKEEQLRYLGQHDSLTGLHNRACFQEEMRLLENGGANAGIILCDVDGLKLVNDFLGHDEGDQLLISTGKVLKKCFREGDCIARIGGDEFAVPLKNTSEVLLVRACQRIKDAIDGYNILAKGVPLSLSVGWAVRTDYSQSVTDLFKEADNRMYQEKVKSAQNVRSSIAKAMMKILQERDFYKESYEFRLEKMVANLAIAAGIDEEKLNDLVLLAQFHNYGKVEVPLEVMLIDGELTDAERAQIQRHCEIGQRIIQLVPELYQQAEWILKHHEWWNGRGTPGGILGESIPIEARILAICDLYDILTNENYNQQTLGHDEAIERIKGYAGSRFDPYLVKKFIEIAG